MGQSTTWSAGRMESLTPASMSSTGDQCDQDIFSIFSTHIYYYGRSKQLLTHITNLAANFGIELGCQYTLKATVATSPYKTSNRF